jgi:hypothetical protein
MPDDNGGFGNTLLAVIVGGLLVVVVTIFAFGGFPEPRVGTSGSSLSFNAPSAPAPTTTR